MIDKTGDRTTVRAKEGLRRSHLEKLNSLLIKM